MAFISIFSFSYAFLIVWNLFFRDGAYFLDAGQFQYSLCTSHLADLPPGEASIWGVQSLFQLHGAYFPAGLCHTINFFHNGPVSFIILLGFQTSLISLVGYFIAIHFTKSKRLRFLTSLSLVLSSPCIGSLGYPHYEALGAAVGALGLIFYIRYKKIFGLAFIVLAAYTREDVGLLLTLFTATTYFCLGKNQSELEILH
jgi:hypothetical protein